MSQVAAAAAAHQNLVKFVTLNPVKIFLYLLRLVVRFAIRVPSFTRRLGLFYTRLPLLFCTTVFDSVKIRTEYDDEKKPTTDFLKYFFNAISNLYELGCITIL